MERRFDRHFLRYFASIPGGVLLVLGGVFALNLAIDPLWYASGNKLTGRNFGFDERIAKANLFEDRGFDVDCVIVGSSKVTLLPASEVGDGRSCFNFSFSAASLPEMTGVLRYLQARGVEPDLVIVGLDDYQFYPPPPNTLPAFFARGEAPPAIVPTYLSLGALMMSVRTLVGDSPLPRYYDGAFEARALTEAGDYEPPTRIEDAVARREAFMAGLTAPPPRRIDPALATAELGALTAVFPDADYVGYTPPLSEWYRAAMVHDGEWDDYVKTLIGVSGLFESFCDFSSVRLAGFADGSYDGVHFVRQANAQVAAALVGPDRCGIGVEVRAESLERLLRTDIQLGRPSAEITQSDHRG